MIGSLLIQIWSFNHFNIRAGWTLYVIAVAVAFGIGGVGAGLATWGEATSFFRQIFKSVSKVQEEKEEEKKEEK